MGLYEDTGLDPKVDRNSFTKEYAAKVFSEAIESLKSGAVAADVLTKLLDAGYTVLQILSNSKPA